MLRLKQTNIKGQIMRSSFLLAIILLASCESPTQQQLQPQQTNEQAQPAQAPQQSSGLLDHMISSAAGGFAAGAGAAVAHQATTGLIDKWRTHARARRINNIRNRRR